MKAKQLLTNTIWYGVIPKLPAIILILILPFITPFLTLEDYGIIGIIRSYRGIALGLATFGLHMHLTNSFFELGSNFKLLWRRLLFYMIVSSFIVTILLIIIYFYSLPIDTISVKWVVIFLAIVPLILVPSQTIINHYYPLVYQPKRQVLTSLVGSLVSIVSSFMIIRYLGWGYIGWLVGAALFSITVFILFIKPFYIKLRIYPQPDFKLGRIKEMLRISLPVIPHSLGYLLLSSSDRIVMDVFDVPLVNIGLYSNGYQIGENAYTVIQGIFVALAPVLQRIFRSNNVVKMKYYYRLSNLIISVFIFLCILWMKEFYIIFIRNDSFQPAYKIAILICSSYIVSSTIYSYMSTAIFITKNTKKIVYLLLFPAVINITLNFILIPIYGYIVAVYTTILSYWIVFLLPFILPTFRKIIQQMLGNRRILIEGFLINITVLFISALSYDIDIKIKLLIVVVVLLLSFYYYKKLENLNADLNSKIIN